MGKVIRVTEAQLEKLTGMPYSYLKEEDDFVSPFDSGDGLESTNGLTVGGSQVYADAPALEIDSQEIEMNPASHTTDDFAHEQCPQGAIRSQYYQGQRRF